MRRICILVMSVLFAATLAAPLSSPAFAADPRSGASACTHYDNRARFKSRTTDIEFIAVLADACAGALGTLAEPAAPASRKAAAQEYLVRLGEARAAIDAIDGARLRAAPSGLTNGPRLRDIRASRRLVTVTGEFLILRRAGVFAALDAWVAEGANFGLLAALR